MFEDGEGRRNLRSVVRCQRLDNRYFSLSPNAGCLRETSSFTFGTGGAGVFHRANPTGLLANGLQLEGMAVRIRRSFVSIVAPLSEETGGAAGRRHGCRD